MKNTQITEFHRPFKQLKNLLKNKPPETADLTVQKPGKRQAHLPKTIDERQLFLEAVADVRPIKVKRYAKRQGKVAPAPTPVADEDSDIITQLNDLIETGQGFVVSHTPEYMEGGPIPKHPEITRRLHRGDFSIQAHIDLHGLGVREARDELEVFLKDAIQTDKRTVLIIHGRGLSSPGKPVLKTRVYEWLTRGPWRKWVIAFTSARIQDGGAGATYVLLRRRPLNRRSRKALPLP